MQTIEQKREANTARVARWRAEQRRPQEEASQRKIAGDVLACVEAYDNPAAVLEHLLSLLNELGYEPSTALVAEWATALAA